MRIVSFQDGLFLLGKKLDIIKGYSKAILTPNFPEFGRLYQAAFDVENVDEEKMRSGEAAKELANFLGCTIFQKGSSDIITNGTLGTFAVARINFFLLTHLLNCFFP